MKNLSSKTGVTVQAGSVVVLINVVAARTHHQPKHGMCC